LIIFCSVIIPTIGRPSLARAVQSVLEQVFDEAPFEVIVVNDSGAPLPEASWQESERVTILHTNRRERSFARNCGAAVGRGKYFYFLDDDDWLLPGALSTFWQLAREAPAAAWLHGGVRVMGADGRILAECNSGVQGSCLAQIMGGAWAPIQSSIVRAEDFNRVGGYNPFIRGTEDQDLCRRIAVHGALANTPAVVACLFRGDNWRTSTNYGRAAEDTRRSRDQVVEQPGVFKQLLASAQTGYWRGRVVHVYVGLARWRLRRRRPLASASALLHGATAMLFSLPHLFERTFWQAIRDDHVPGSLHHIQAAWEREDG